MKLCVTPCDIKGEIGAIASKSYAHRAIICAALADEKTSLYIRETSKDIDATLSCIKAMGAEVICDDRTYHITPITKKEKRCILDASESGSTLRFLIPVAAALGINAEFKGFGRLPERPLHPIINLLKEKGIEFSGDSLPFEINGKLSPGEFKIAGDISSQFISGLMFALSYLSGESTINLTSRLESKAYVDMTIDVLSKFGAEIKENSAGYIVKGKGFLTSPKEYIIEGDWSNAAFFIVGGALSGDISLSGLNINSKQSDKKILDILKLAGADISCEDNEIHIKKSKLKPFCFDFSECPDIFPIAGILACGAEGKTTLSGAKRLRIKESDRIEATKKLILDLGGRAEDTEDSLIIHGKGFLNGGEVSSFNDHRIAMSAIIASLICKNSVILEGAEAIDKSYPDFISHFESLGGKINVI